MRYCKIYPLKLPRWPLMQHACLSMLQMERVSSSDKKKDEATKLGAHEFIATRGAKELPLIHLRRLKILYVPAQRKMTLMQPLQVLEALAKPRNVSGNSS
ncbi:hypothetical protein NHQ30_011331 [Ciborinia camelliae]|nr:hypothetical protein NHQ30_011331 [Ciborinia camelliae]